MLTACRKQIGEEKKKNAPHYKKLALCLTGPFMQQMTPVRLLLSAVLAGVISMSVTLSVLTCCHVLKCSCSPSVARSAHSEPFPAHVALPGKLQIHWYYIFHARWNFPLYFDTSKQIFVLFFLSVLLLAKVNSMPLFF